MKRPQVMHLYVDDSGTRHPDRNPGTRAAHNHDWFALGGVLIKNEDEHIARAHHVRFMRDWGLDPAIDFLHSTEIRNKNERFSWLGALSKTEHMRFMEELYELMRAAPFLGFACVIDRPGYNARYRERYGRERWSLCRTAFSVLVERATKYAQASGCRLRVYVERSDPTADSWMKNYYEHLLERGLPFDADSMKKYDPLTSPQLKQTLLEFRLKYKSSPIMQIADLYLWAMAIGGYHRSNRTYARLMTDKKLIDAHLSADDVPTVGIKYSCWDHVEMQP
jgi:Protein of unknown function (DUF3800)